MIPVLDSQVAILLTSKLAALAILVTCAEYLVLPSPLKDGGLMSWRVGKLRSPLLVLGFVEKTLNWVLSYPNVLGLLIIRALAASVVILGPPSLVVNPYIICLIVFPSWLFIVRSYYGHDGADQMGIIIFTGLAVVSIVATHTTGIIFLWFITFQGCLSYATAGFAKATAKGWRDGTYLVGIVGTDIYGSAVLRDFLRSKPSLTKWLSRLIVVWECSFPLVLLVPLPLGILILVSGFFFHLVNAYIMGLNDFLWSFLATYPAILYCIQTRSW